MPYKFEKDKIPMPRDKDRRVKLTEEQRQEIRDNVDSLSSYQLAAKYGVSRRLIQFIRFPEKHAENLLRRSERGGWKQYYDKDEHTESQRKYRQHKAAVLSHKQPEE